MRAAAALGSGLVGLLLLSAPASGAGRPTFEDHLANLKSPNAKTRQESAQALGKSRRRGSRADSQPKSGVETRSTRKVTVIIEGRCCTPLSMAISSRTGRRM